MAFYELRQYKILPGKMVAWLKVMEEKMIPFQMAKGCIISASFRGESDETLYFWIRRFENEAEPERIYRDIYQSDHWKNVIAPKLDALRDPTGRIVKRVVPTKLSTAQ